MENENNSQSEATPDKVVEDLTVSDTETTNIKGGSGRYLLELRDVKGDVSE